MTLSGTVVTVFGPTVLAVGSTVLAVGSVVASGVKGLGFFPVVVALGTTPSCPLLIEVGLIPAVGDTGRTFGILTVVPTPLTARPRCAKLTLVSNPSSIPQTSTFSYLFLQ
jgi:hypothetical protein